MMLTLEAAPPLEAQFAQLSDDSAVTALLFPGAAGQTGCHLDIVWATAPDLAARAVVEVGADPFKRAEFGTRFRQPAVYCASIATWMRLGRPQPRFVAGYSTGEFAALAVAGAFSVEEGLRLVALRGRLVQESIDNSPPGGMIVVSGLSESSVRALSRRHGLVIAGENCPGEFALGGDSVVLWAAATDAVSYGGSCVRLPLARSTHGAAVEEAAAKFEEALRDTDIRQPQLDVFSCTSAAPVDDVRARLVESLVRPIRWRSTLVALHEAGARHFVDVGPCEWLAPLVRQTLPDARIDSAAA